MELVVHPEVDEADQVLGSEDVAEHDQMVQDQPLAELSGNLSPGQGLLDVLEALEILLELVLSDALDVVVVLGGVEPPVLVRQGLSQKVERATLFRVLLDVATYR